MTMTIEDEPEDGDDDDEKRNVWEVKDEDS